MTNITAKHITDDDLVLLFYGEHDDPELAAIVACSTELSARFDALRAELKLVDTFVPPHRGDDYGSDVWQQISPRLADETAQSKGRIQAWLSSFTQPRFSFGGALAFVLVAALAFTLGRNNGPDGITTPTDPLQATGIVLAGIDSARLLTSAISGHLEQVDLVLTQFANTSVALAGDADRATGMLVANRLYRQAAVSQGKHKLAAFLAELEPLLIELAYEAHTASPVSRERMQKEVRNGLLFRVRVMNKQLNNSQISA